MPPPIRNPPLKQSAPRNSWLRSSSRLPAADANASDTPSEVRRGNGGNAQRAPNERRPPVERERRSSTDQRASGASTPGPYSLLRHVRLPAILFVRAADS